MNDAGLAVVSGYTFSTSGIASVGAHKTQLTGTSDAFLMLFNANGTRQWGTYYGGGALDRGNDASMAMNGRVALVGQTNSPSGIASRGAPDVSLGGGMDGFVAWFSPTGARLFGSYIGGSGDDWATGVAAGFANSEFVVSGTTMSASGIATAGSHDASYNGLHDAFMALYNGSGTGTKTWSTYYGGTGYDFGMGSPGSARTPSPCVERHQARSASRPPVATNPLTAVARPTGSMLLSIVSPRPACSAPTSGEAMRTT